MNNPCSCWLPDSCWDNVTELDKLFRHCSIVSSFQQSPRDWNAWFISAEPENSTLPGPVASIMCRRVCASFSLLQTPSFPFPLQMTWTANAVRS